MKKTTQAEAEVVPSSRLVEVEVGVPRTLVEVIPSVFQWEKKSQLKLSWACKLQWSLTIEIFTEINSLLLQNTLKSSG